MTLPTVTPAQKRLLDFISIRESDENYNAVIGNAYATDDLGQYGGLVVQYGIDRSTKFTPDFQDQLGAALLENRHYESWVEGHIDDADFAHLLSCEWASLPDPDNDGRSHYDGDDAGNHAGQSLDAVYASLAAARALLA